MKRLLPILAMAILLGTVSCGKSKIRKDISGTWNLVDVTENGVNFYTSQGGSISGTYTFSEMSKKENKQGSGTVLQDIVISMQGQTQSFTETAGYFVIDKESIFFADSEFKINLSTNAMVLTSTDDPSGVIEITLSR